MSLGNNIYQLRTGRGLSQGDLADALQVSRQSISKWEVGGAVPDLDKLLALSDLFGVTLDELVRGEIGDEVAPAAAHAESDAAASAEPREQAVASPEESDADGDASTLRIVLICILVFLVLSLFASFLTPLLAGGLPFILIGVGCFLFALRK